MTSSSELDAMQSLAQKLGLTTMAIRRFGQHVAELAEDEVVNYSKLLDAVETASTRPLHIILSQDANLREAFWETQCDEVAKWGLTLGELALIGPNVTKGETWTDADCLARTIRLFAKHSGEIDLRKLNAYSHRCWQEILSTKRRYAVPSRAKAEILASNNLTTLMGLKSIHFLKEGAYAPAVYVRFEFQKPSVIGIVKIQRNGTVKGFHEKVPSPKFRAIIAAISIAYYRDLVVPTEKFDGRPNIPVRDKVKPKGEPSGHSTSHPRSLPRQVVDDANTPLYQFAEWHYAQERARHPVVGHRRWVGRKFRAGTERRNMALAEGVVLPPGYTWIMEHERGAGNPGELSLNGFDLPDHTVFAAPQRASRELRKCFV